MGTVALTVEQVCGLAHNEGPIEGALAFFASRTKESVRHLAAPASEVFSGVGASVDQLLLDIIEARTKADFESVFNAALPKYAAITFALAKFAQVMLRPEDLSRLARESVCEMEADFRDKALGAFGGSVREQLLFTAWTVRKIHELLLLISAANADESKAKEDQECCANFAFHAMRANLSLDCFKMALRQSRPIYPEVTEGLKDGLRSMVNAYAWVRRGAALRAGTPSLPFEPGAVADEEDEFLLRTSMEDMALMDED